MEAITNSLSELTNEQELSTKKIKQTLQHVIKFIQNSTDLYRPSMKKIFTNITLDKETQLWMANELGGVRSLVEETNGMFVEDISTKKVLCCELTL
jgi:hypothetical protein